MKRPSSPGAVARWLAPLSVYLLDFVVAIALLAFCVPLHGFAVLAILTHTVFPIWWCWPSEGERFRPQRAGQAIGNFLVTFVGINVLYFAILGVAVIAMEIDSAAEQERRSEFGEATHQQASDLDSTTPAPAFDLGLPTYLSLPKVEQLLVLPFALATLVACAWAVTVLHQVAMAQVSGRLRPARVTWADLDPRPSIRWVRPSAPELEGVSWLDPGVHFVDDERRGQPDNWRHLAGLDLSTQTDPIQWLDDGPDGDATGAT